MKLFKRNRQLPVCAIVLTCALTVGMPAHAQMGELTVSAAASTRESLTQIGARFGQTHQINIHFNFASSGALQQQIVQGAPVDVFVSADDKNMDALAKLNLIEKGSRAVIARNRLVLVVPKGSTLKIHRFKDVTQMQVARISIGAPSVPAGKRAQEVFEKLGIWPQVQSKAIRAKDVRAALTQVELGNAQAGIVYRTDALFSNKVRIVAVAPVSMHAPIHYSVAVVKSSRVRSEAREFARFLSSAPAQAIFKRRGFSDK